MFLILKLEWLKIPLSSPKPHCSALLKPSQMAPQQPQALRPPPVSHTPVPGDSRTLCPRIPVPGGLSPHPRGHWGPPSAPRSESLGNMRPLSPPPPFWGPGVPIVPIPGNHRRPQCPHPWIHMGWGTLVTLTPHPWGTGDPHGPHTLVPVGMKDTPPNPPITTLSPSLGNQGPPTPLSLGNWGLPSRVPLPGQRVR